MVDIVELNDAYELANGLKRGIVVWYAIEGATDQESAILIADQRLKALLKVGA